jgi:hypothetical protein
MNFVKKAFPTYLSWSKSRKNYINNKLFFSLQIPNSTLVELGMRYVSFVTLSSTVRSSTIFDIRTGELLG